MGVIHNGVDNFFEATPLFAMIDAFAYERKSKMATRWRDPRLGVGVLLVALSGLGGALALSGPEKVQVYRARSAIVPGTALAKADLDVVEIDKTLAGPYVGPTSAKGSVNSVVGRGEFVAKSQIGRQGEMGMRMVVPLMSPAPASAAPGAQVELWRISRRQTQEGQAGASLAAPEVLVVSVSEGDSNAGGKSTAEVEVPDRYVSQVLSVLGSNDGYVIVGKGK